MKMPTNKESLRPEHFRPTLRTGSAFARVAWILCVLATHNPAAGQVPFVYRNPYLLVTEGTATVTDPAGNRRTVEATTVEDTKAERKVILPGVAVIAGGETVETAEKSVASLLSPTAGTAMASGETAFRLSSGAVSPKAGDEKRQAGTSTSLEMLKGTLWLRIDGDGLRKADQSPEFRLRMPKNILAVKGTEFFVSHSEVIDRANRNPVVKTGVMMKKGVVELCTAEGKPQQNLVARNMADTIYMLDTDGGIADVIVLGDSNENEAAAVANLPRFRIDSDLNVRETYFSVAERLRREVTVEANEHGSKRPRRKPEYATLSEADEEGVISLGYRRPEKGSQPEELVVRILMIRNTYKSALLLSMRSSAKVEAKLDGALISDRRVLARVGLNEPGWNLKLGDTDTWQAALVPLFGASPAGENEDDEKESFLTITLETPPELSEFKIEFSPILLTEGVRPSR